MPTAETIKHAFEKHLTDKGIKTLMDGHKGAIVGCLTRACGGEDNRRDVLQFLTGKRSTKQLTLAEWWALSKFVAIEHVDSYGWLSAHGPKFNEWCAAILQQKETA